MIDKLVDGADAAVADIPDGATLLVSGFGPPGLPTTLVQALVRQGARDLTIVNNNAAAGGRAMMELFSERRVRKVICSFPKAPESTIFEELYFAGELELELVPQGTLAERIRAAGAGLGGFLTPTGYGTELAEGKETRMIDGVGYVLEPPLPGDFAFVKARTADRAGNLVYQKTARNFGPIMATAASTTVVEVAEVVDRGALDPEVVITPGIYVDRLVHVPAQEEAP